MTKKKDDERISAVASAMGRKSAKVRTGKQPKPKKRSGVRVTKAVGHEWASIGGKAKVGKMSPEEHRKFAQQLAQVPRKYPRCPCGKSTLKRAQARGYDCCRKAGVEVPRKSE